MRFSRGKFKAQNCFFLSASSLGTPKKSYECKDYPKSKGGQLAKHETSVDHSFTQRKNFFDFFSFWCHCHHHLLLLKMKPNWISPWTWTFPKAPSQRLSKLKLDSDLF